MKNNLIDYYSIIYSILENQMERFDVLIADADTGENTPMTEAKASALEELTNTIKVLEELREEITGKSLRILNEHYGITSN